MYEKRWYQTEAVEASVKHMIEEPGSPLVALPTGTGKSIVIADVVTHFVTRHRKMRVAMLTHSKELVKQNAGKLRDILPEADLGIFSAGLGEKDSDNQVVYASVQSVASAMKNGENPFGVRHLVVVDEAHMIGPGEATQYKKVLSAWRAAYPTMKVLGLTATPYRMKGGMLTEGEDSLFTDVVYDCTSVESFNRLIAEGYLCPLVAYKPPHEVDLTGVKLVAGDFNLKQASAAVGRGDTLEKACDEMVLRGADRKCWLVFTSGVENAERVANLLKSRGISAAAVHSKQDSRVNDLIIQDFKDGKIRALVNADMLTTGFDVPQIDLIGMLRPTMSAGLWVQMLGRGTRPFSGKINCLVLDFAGNTARLGPINDPVLPRKGKKKGGEAPMKVCPICSIYVHTSVRTCPSCDHEFAFSTQIHSKASVLDLIRTHEIDKPKIEVWTPFSVQYSVYKKDAESPACLKVDYNCAEGRVTKYVPWEHKNGTFLADEWFANRFSGKRPDKAEDFMKHVRRGVLVKKPLKIRVDVNSRWKGRVRPELVSEIFKEKRG